MNTPSTPLPRRGHRMGRATFIASFLSLMPGIAPAGTLIDVNLPATGSELTELALPTPVGAPISGGFDALTYWFEAPQFLRLGADPRPTTLELLLTLSTTGEGQITVPAEFRLLDAAGQTTLSADITCFALADEFFGSGEITASFLDDREFHGVELAIDARELQGDEPGAVTGGTVLLSASGFGNLEVGVKPTADFDDDGDVDGEDLATWTSGYGTTGTDIHVRGDADFNNVVEGADLLIWQRQLNAGDAKAAALGATIPEPACLTLLLTLLLPALKLRMHDRRLLLALFIGVAAGSARADLFEWTDPVDGNYATAGNWTRLTGATAAPPGVGDDARFNEPGDYVVTFNSGGITRSDQVALLDGSVRFQRSSPTIPATLALTTGEGRLFLNDAELTLGGIGLPLAVDVGQLEINFGALAVNGGSTLDADALVSTVGDRQISVHGSGSAFNLGGPGAHELGGGGATGALMFDSDATGEISGTLNVAGADSLLHANGGASVTLNNLNLGGDGSTAGAGTLRVTTSSSVTVNGTINVGSGLSSGLIELFSGIVTLNGAANIEDGGEVVLTDGAIAFNGAARIEAGGQVVLSNGTTTFNDNVTNSGGLLQEDDTPTSSVTFGLGATFITEQGGVSTFDGRGPDGIVLNAGGDLRVLTGGQMRVHNINGTGQLKLRQSDITVSGAGSMLQTDQMFVGDAGTDPANVEVNAGGLLDTGGLMIGPLGAVDIESAILDVVVVGIDGGQIQLTDAALENLAILTLEGGGSIAASGQLALSNFAGGSQGAEVHVTEGSSIAAGDGFVFESFGNLSFEVVGTGSSVTAGGTSLLRSFSLSQFGVFPFSDGATGTFNNLTIDAAFLPEVGVFDVGGTLVVESGANVTVQGDLLVGTTAVSAKTGILVQSAGSSLDVTSPTATFQVGGSPTSFGVLNEITVRNSAELVAAGALLLDIDALFTLDDGVATLGGLQALGNGQVDFQSGQLTVNSALAVGPASPFPNGLSLVAGRTLIVGDALTIKPSSTLLLDGGTLTVESLAVHGAFDFRSGTFNLTGSDLTVGAGGLLGEDALLIEPDQTITVAQQTVVNAGSELIVIGGFDSGSLVNHGDLVLIDTTGAGRTIAGDVATTAGSTITVLGTVDFNGLVGGEADFFGPGTANFHGGLAPGASLATTSFEGSVSLANANTLFIEIAGTTPGNQYDALSVAGTATLGGQLAVELIDGFTLGSNEQFLIADVGGALTGQFAGLSEGALVGQFDGTELFITYSAGDGNDVALFTAGAAFTADFDEDGDVDGDDLAQWRGDFGVNDLSDADDDGDSDGADLLAWQRQLGGGGSAGASPSQQAVPEPHSMRLMVIATILVASARRKG